MLAQLFAPLFLKSINFVTGVDSGPGRVALTRGEITKNLLRKQLSRRLSTRPDPEQLLNMYLRQHEEISVCNFFYIYKKKKLPFRNQNQRIIQEIVVGNQMTENNH